MISVQAYSRLHLGVLRPEGEAAAPLERTSARWFGGVGLMIERPGLRVRVRPASSWSATGPLAERALTFARRFAQNIQQEEGHRDVPPRQLSIEQIAPQHAGLGTGTQLGLAIAQALAVSWELDCDIRTLAHRVGRGLRSALGAHGFEQGGLLVESGKNSADRLAPLVARLPFPESWRVVLILPSTDEMNIGLHGVREVEAFAQLAARPAAANQTDILCRLVLLGLLPAVVERDVDAFGEALYEFNARVGEAFAPVQGGVYASARITELVAFVRGQGVRGVGQSSWGPTVFAVVADEDRAECLAAQLRNHCVLEETTVLVTPACNHGALLEREHEEILV
ncbi:MAG TPA: beta-ribofuranosylaminobenzene 5'-phosphate synthase family protein [Gemmataceae bacterium]|nr:beta-ribofuranosylaminobenzene 5'-phosphate synthase family protein [Gemmataceae bacterium]